MLTREELASFAMRFWEQTDVEAARGAEVIPELLRLADLEARIPRMEVVASVGNPGGAGW